MVKKFLSIALSLLILATTTGFTVKSHYCGKRLMSTKLVILDDHAHCCPGMTITMPTNCCKDEAEFHKLEEDFQTVDQTFDLHAQSQLALAQPVLQQVIPPGLDRNTIKHHNFRPPPIEPDILLMVQSFLL